MHGAISTASTAGPAGLEALADVGKAEPGSLVRRGGNLFLAAVLQAIADLEEHPVIVEVACLDADDDGLAALGHAVLDGVLDDRLEEERWHPRLFKFARNVDLDGEAVWKTGHLDIEIKALEVDFLG